MYDKNFIKNFQCILYNFFVNFLRDIDTCAYRFNFLFNFLKVFQNMFQYYLSYLIFIVMV